MGGQGGPFAGGVAQPQVPPLCPARATLSGTHVSPVSSSPAGTHEVCPQDRVGTGDGPCPQHPHHAWDGITGTVLLHPLHLLPTPVVTRPCWPFGMPPVGTRAMGPSNWDDGGQGGSVLCHGDLLVKARAFGVGFPISKWLRVAPGHSLAWSDGCGQAENMLHSSHPWAEPVPQVLTFPHPKTRAQQGDLRSPWRVGFLVGISAHPGQGRPSTTAVPAHPCLHPATWGSLSNPL